MIEIIESLIVLLVFIGMPFSIIIPFYNLYLLKKAKSLLKDLDVNELSSKHLKPKSGWVVSTLSVRIFILNKHWQGLESELEIQKFRQLYTRLKLSKTVFFVYMFILALTFFFVL